MGGRIGRSGAAFAVAAAAAGLLLGGASAGAQGQAPSAAALMGPAYSPDHDPMFAHPYIDVDEWRTAPVRHRYVHGGFRDTDTRFSFYFPDKAEYRGHFFQWITPVPLSETLSQKDEPGPYNKIGFSIDSGAYFIETNGGGALDLAHAATSHRDPTIGAYRANAAVAAYSRKVAEEMYGAGRPYGYAFGGSGGAYRTIGSIENTRGVWDGAVPYVMGSTMAIPNVFTVRLQALRLLRDRFPGIIDAEDVGGSGAPYAGLTPVQADALREATLLGFPPQTWFGYKTMGLHGLAALYPGVLAFDPTYFTDFWTKPGYLGHNHPERFAADRLQFDGQVAAPITGAEAARLRLNVNASSERAKGGVDQAFKPPVGAEAERVVAYRLAAAPPKTYFLGGDLVVNSGAEAGQRLPLARIVGDIVVLGVADAGVAAKIAPGDRVRVDNSNFLALEGYQRHQVPGPDFPEWNQYRGPDGRPLYPQRPILLGPIFTQMTAGSLETGRFDGKMIVVESLWDREAFPWQADWYRQRVGEHLGAATNQNYRLWYTDHALHGDDPDTPAEDPTRLVPYIGVLEQALRDVSAWVETGAPPPASTRYRIVDGQVVVPPTAASRLGVQPVVTLKVNGGDRIEVGRGTAVAFDGAAETPPGGGYITKAEWDFGAGGGFADQSAVPERAQTAKLAVTHRFDQPGVYFTTLRITAQRQGDRSTPYALIQNLGRVRVVVR